MKIPDHILAFLGLLLLQIGCGSAVSLYEYYIPNGSPSSGLVAEGDTFTLNGKDITIFSGSFHYFRIHPDYWRDTLRKLRAAGLNAVQTYVPWNLHEPRIGEFNFDTLDDDMSDFLDLRSFLQMAQEEDLFVILRPGPFITSEWEFGGLPGWLMRDHTMRVRTSYTGFTEPVEAYFTTLLPYLNGMQFVDGGPVIAVQIENEYGSFGYEYEVHDKAYLNFLKTLIEENGFRDSLLFTSDNPTVHYDYGSLPGVLQTANFNSDPDGNFATLKMLQPNRPLMVAEFWTGWFDIWLSDHSGWWVDDFAAMYEYIVGQGVSINLYMFIGGTNFGFMAGANEWWGPDYYPLVTSYDYDAPLSEAGDYTEKYWRIQEILSRYNPLQGIVDNPAVPDQRVKAAYGNFPVTDFIELTAVADQVADKVESTTGPINMEALPINSMSGQMHGYILYTTRANLAPASSLMIRGHVRDMAQVIVDGTLVTRPYGNDVGYDSFGFWEAMDASITIDGTGSESQIDILVENLGRVNSGAPHVYNNQRKGLWEGPVLLNRNEIKNWTITSLEFKKPFVNGLTGWTTFAGTLATPAMYRATLTLDTEPQDTFLDMSNWNKGVVFINGFNLGRYWRGPTLTLYVPAPLMNIGVNEVVVFEQYEAANEIVFIDYPILG